MVGQRWLAHLVADAQIEPYSEGGTISLTRSAVDRMNVFLRRAAGVHKKRWSRLTCQPAALRPPGHPESQPARELLDVNAE